jgi:exopolysaccharide biosynthesis WecB/TagA/CpsF family protein
MDDNTCTLQISDCDVPTFIEIAANYGTGTFGYAVTPNVDHVLRYAADAPFRDIYRKAAFVLFDSRFLARVVGLTKGQRLPTCPGSDFTGALLNQVIAPDDAIVVIGGSRAQADALRRRYSLKRLQHFVPPMGFIRDPAAVEQCLRFIEEASPFRFCFLCVGCPQQELLAQMLQARGRARGLALCVGGAINFLTGAERRAPAWVQACGLEWLHRLVLDPRRLSERYLVRGPRIFFLLPRLRFVLRAATAAKGPGPAGAAAAAACTLPAPVCTAPLATAPAAAARIA